MSTKDDAKTVGPARYQVSDGFLNLARDVVFLWKQFWVSMQDWLDGTRRISLWYTLAYYDVFLRYRRSALGPLWITISMGCMLLGMGPLYALLFNVPLKLFFPHLALGIIFWNFFTTTINEGCVVFIHSAGFIQHREFPLSVFAWRSLAKQCLFLAHHIVLYVPVALWAGYTLSGQMLLFLPGLLLVLSILHLMAMSLGIICARFRDVVPIVTSILQLLMFLTPIFWFPDQLPERAKFVLYNPLAQMLDVLRVPLMGGYPAAGTWWFLVDFALLNVALAAVLYAYARKRLVYWV